MPLVQIKDKSCQPMEMLEWDGCFLPRHIAANLEGVGLQDYLNGGAYSRCKVFMCSYPRSGFHWLYELVNMLMNKTLSVTKITGKETIIEFRRLVEGETSMDSQPILQTHLGPELVPESLQAVKTVYTYRNPKDVAYSKYKFECQIQGYTGTFEDYIGLFLEGRTPYGCWFDHTLKWEKACREQDICVVSYDDLSKNPLPTLRRLASYLEVDVDDDFLMAVHKACHVDNLRGKNVVQEGVGEVLSLVRKGVAGGWKEHFTVALSEQFDRVFAEKMKTSEFKFTC